MGRFVRVHSPVFLCISIAILLGNLATSSALLAKCCPADTLIDIASGNINCVKSENTTEWDSYNIAVSPDQTQFPLCEYNVQHIFQAPTDFSVLNGCLDKSPDGEFYSMECKNHPTVAVHRLNKCCPVNHSYDHTERFCVPNTDSVLHFQELFGNNLVVFEPNVPDCTDDEAFVEYYTTAHDIDFVDRNLKIVSDQFPSGELLQSDKYCVEGLINSTAVKRQERHVIVRSCRPRNICDDIPCIRRCCKNDQMYQRDPVTKKPQCVQHPNSANFVPIFYDINFPLEPNKSQAKIHQKGLTQFPMKFVDVYFVVVELWIVNEVCRRVLYTLFDLF